MFVVPFFVLFFLWWCIKI